MRADKTERLYQCAVTVAMIEAIVVPLFGFIVGPYYHKPSLATAPAFTEQQRVAIDDPRGSHITTGALPTLPCEKPALATAIVQEIGVVSANCPKSSSRHWSRAHVRGQRDIP
jgi:hypothetical protein